MLSNIEHTEYQPYLFFFKLRLGSLLVIYHTASCTVYKQLQVLVGEIY